MAKEKSTFADKARIVAGNIRKITEAANGVGFEVDEDDVNAMANAIGELVNTGSSVGRFRAMERLEDMASGREWMIRLAVLRYASGVLGKLQSPSDINGVSDAIEQLEKESKSDG